MNRLLLAALLAGGFLTVEPGIAAPAPALASYPLFLAPPTTPNVLVLFDNSGSMDATMSGKVVSGDLPDTRSNIARQVLRNVIDDNRSGFNWGLGTFELSGAPALYNTQVLFVGSDATMVYTNTCSVPIGSVADMTGYSADGPQKVISADGVTPVVYKNNCLLNPDVDATGTPRNGQRYLTFEESGDDASINDVFYTGSNDVFAFGIGVVGAAGRPNRYLVYRTRDASTAWTSANFSATNCVYCPIDFTPTDAGWLPKAASQQRMLFIKRGWGYGNGISGKGRMVEPVVSSARVTAAEIAAETAHYNTLMTALAPETNLVSGEIKNGAFSTPLAGTLKTARDYFAGNLTGVLKSPVVQSCQKNYVVLATDGNPTGKQDGSQYPPLQWLNNKDAAGNWTYGQAQLDVFAQIGVFAANGTPTGGLRATTLSGANQTNPALFNKSFDVQTYVIGLGDTVINDSSIASLNQMAKLGGGNPEAFLGTSPQAVQTAFQAIVSSIQKKQGGSSSIALNASTLSATSRVYQATFNSSDWTGDLKALAIAANGTLSAIPSWSSAVQIAAQDWNTDRTLLTYKPSAAAGSRGIAFRWPVNSAAPTAFEIDTAQATALNTSSAGVVDNHGKLRLQFLRGDRSREANNCATCTPQFRNRSTPLGDLINSTPVLVGAPSGNYYDDIESAPYSAFVAARRTRTKVLYVGGNDGMLHGISADTGRELLGYVPSPLVASLNQLTTPGYVHRYFADGTPTVGDAFYAGSWKSLLVSGMRAGAKGVFALDITNPTSFTEGNASNIVRWEFLNAQDADMGHLFSQPVIVKTNNGRWSVIVGNGYNSGSASGHAVLFVLDAETGAVVRKIDTGAGTALSPNGLSGPAVIDTNDDGVADVVYAGDLNGNLWKFDLSAAAVASWGLGNGGLALFNTDENNPGAGTRAITSRPNVTLFPRGGYMVVFGSGSYLSVADASSGTQQALYGIWDNLVPGTVLQASLVSQTVVSTATGADGALYRLTTHAVGDPLDTAVTGDAALTLASYYSSKRGWLLNLPSGGERSVTDSRIRGGRAVYTTLIPNITDPCAYGGSGWLMELNVVTGNRDDRGTFDTNSNAAVDADDNIAFTAGVKNVGSGRFFDGIPAAPGSLVNDDGSTPPPNQTPGQRACTELRYVAKSDGTTQQVVVACGNSSFGRAMWREVR